MRYKLCLIEKTLLYHKADNSDSFLMNKKHFLRVNTEGVLHTISSIW